VTRTEAELAQAVAVRAFTELLHDALNDPRISKRVENLAAALTLAVAANDAVPLAPVVPLHRKESGGS
jgi:hypothetical protein